MPRESFQRSVVSSQRRRAQSGAERPVAPHRPAEFEAECLAGLERFAAAELAGIADYSAPPETPHPPAGVTPHPPPPSPARGRGGAEMTHRGLQKSAGKRSLRIAPGSFPEQLPDEGADDRRHPLSRTRERGAGGEGHNLRFQYGGSWQALLRLRTVTAVHAVIVGDLPRPTALLDDGTFRQIVSVIGHVRSLHPSGAFKTVRISAAGAGSAAFSRVLARLTETTGLRATQDAADLLLTFRRGPDGRFELLARISPRPLSARGWRVCNLPGALNATVAAVMASLTRATPTDVYLNLACGSGTLLVERALAGPATRLLGCDLSPEALECARQNLDAAGIPEAQVEAWDATALPLGTASVDAITVDLPFGQLLGSHTANAELYPRLLAEAARVARTGARLVAITQQVRLFERSVAPAQWSVEEVLRPVLPTNAAPIKPGIYVLARR